MSSDQVDGDLSQQGEIADVVRSRTRQSARLHLLDQSHLWGAQIHEMARFYDLRVIGTPACRVYICDVPEIAGTSKGFRK
jgi:hypothetical protein